MGSFSETFWRKSNRALAPLLKKIPIQQEKIRLQQQLNEQPAYPQAY